MGHASASHADSSSLNSLSPLFDSVMFFFEHENGVAELEMPSAAEDAEFNEEATETSSSGSEGGASILNR